MYPSGTRQHAPTDLLTAVSRRYRPRFATLRHRHRPQSGIRPGLREKNARKVPAKRSRHALTVTRDRGSTFRSPGGCRTPPPTSLRNLDDNDRRHQAGRPPESTATVRRNRKRVSAFSHGRTRFTGFDSGRQAPPYRRGERRRSARYRADTGGWMRLRATGDRLQEARSAIRYPRHRRPPRPPRVIWQKT